MSAEPEPADKSTASGFMTALAHDHERPDQDDNFGGDLIGKIAVRGHGPMTVTVDEAGKTQEVGPTLEIRFCGAETGLILHVMLDANEAIRLARRIAKQVRIARGGA